MRDNYYTFPPDLSEQILQGMNKGDVTLVTRAWIRRLPLKKSWKKLKGKYTFFFFKEISILIFIYLFIYGCVGSSFLCEGFLQLRQVGATLHRDARASHHRGLSCCGAQAQTRRLSSCGSRAQPLRGMWDLPRPGLEPVSPAFAGGFSTTVPPGKPLYFLI